MIVAKLIARRVVAPSGCWLWAGSVNDSGYGAVLAWGKVRYVHRVSAALFLGYDIADTRAMVCHACDVRHCFNPEHLWIGSPLENVADMLAKGRGRHQREPLPNHSVTAPLQGIVP